MSFSRPESAASLLAECYSNGLAQSSPSYSSGHGRGRRCLAASCGLQASITMSSSAHQLSSLLPAGTAWHAAEVIHGTAVPLQGEREQKSFPVSLDLIRERTAGNVGASHYSSAATKLGAALWTCSPLRTCPMKTSSFVQWYWSLRGCKSNLNNKK